MSVATAAARSAVLSTSTISRHEPRKTRANAQAWPTAPTPTTPTLRPSRARLGRVVAMARLRLAQLDAPRLHAPDVAGEVDRPRAHHVAALGEALGQPERPPCRALRLQPPALGAAGPVSHPALAGEVDATAAALAG